MRLLDQTDEDIFDAAVRTFRHADIANHKPFLTDPATIAFAAIDGPDVIGWAWGTRQRHAGGYSQVQLYEIGVVDARRGQGVDRALVTAFVDLVIREGHRKMWLFTDHGNTIAQALYLSVGGEPSRHDDAAFWWQIDTT